MENFGADVCDVLRHYRAAVSFCRLRRRDGDSDKARVATDCVDDAVPINTTDSCTRGWMEIVSSAAASTTECPITVPNAQGQYASAACVHRTNANGMDCPTKKAMNARSLAASELRVASNRKAMSTSRRPSWEILAPDEYLVRNGHHIPIDEGREAIERCLVKSNAAVSG
ncbi:hypothetical protein LTS03_011760 [Exophiala xenobiotica]|nr:hypothetical protein LTR41_011558 [Exophiala xenobiotica]KAK5215118.1 hypothetical protein LTR72_011806 [Exophiala xenobiotica]KAK5280679.1 hypothetical protein LTR40_005994 [Exophiala xenobiotica]KAK5344722.1 hypothetical protein LTR61_011503 [Exophiala xenobiotica]KAK5355181.1 hypothetical protein LTR11_011757 [Exophiala xenobiotica]